MSKKIILFSIGAVQEFIINSRKVLDLYNSSQILSSLIKEGIKFIKYKFNGQVLLPCEYNEINKYIKDKEDENLPNYFIMLYESDKFIGAKVEEKVIESYIDYFKENNSIKEICKENFKQFEEQFRRQLKSSLDIYWVEYELEEDFNLDDDFKYRKVYREINEYFEAVKNVRKFKNINEEGRKCSICGIRNGIFLGEKLSASKSLGMQAIYNYKLEGYEYKNNSIFQLIDEINKKTNKKNLSVKEIRDIDRKKEYKLIYLAQDNNSKIYLKKNEMLCAVCLLKRLYSKNKEDNQKKTYPSLAQITLSGWIANVSDKEEYEAFKQNIEECIKHKPVDIFYAMYKENWDSININDKIQKRLGSSLKKLIKNNKLPKYYCVYRMDIDNLGKWMSGLYMEKDLSLYEYQSQLSQAINKFFNNISRFMANECCGKLIYAGGDDLLALIPINEIFKISNKIREYFKKIIKIHKLKNKNEENFKNITYSQGIFIAHHKAPLGEVVRVSQEELQQCKERFKNKTNYFDTEKDGTVISIMTEGYRNEKVYFKNSINNKSCINFIVDEIIPYFKYSSTYFHDELQKQYLDFDKNLDKSYEREMLLDMLRIEQRRIMKRSFKEQNKDKEGNIKTKEMNDKLIKFLKVNSRKKDRIDLENYFNLFHIIRKLGQIREGMDYDI